MNLADFARAVFALALTLGLLGLFAVALRRYGPDVLARFATQKTQISAQQAKLTDQQTALRAQLMARFSVADGLITSSKSTLSFLTNQIAQWNKSTS